MAAKTVARPAKAVRTRMFARLVCFGLVRLLWRLEWRSSVGEDERLCRCPFE